MNPSPLKTVRSKLPEQTSAFLKKLSDMAASGEIIGCTCVLEHADGRYSIEWSASLSRLQRIGVLADAMHDLMSRVNK